jgi:hypothetical protein
MKSIQDQYLKKEAQTSKQTDLITMNFRNLIFDYYQ